MIILVRIITAFLIASAGGIYFGIDNKKIVKGFYEALPDIGWKQIVVGIIIGIFVFVCLYGGATEMFNDIVRWVTKK